MIINILRLSVVFAVWFMMAEIIFMGIVATIIWIVGRINPEIEKKRSTIYKVMLVFCALLTGYSMLTSESIRQFWVATEHLTLSKPDISLLSTQTVSNQEEKTALGLFGDTKRIIGSWVEAGTGTSEEMSHYEIFENGEFQYNIGKGLCVVADGAEIEGKLLGYQGKWRVENETLILTVLSKTVLKKGARAVRNRDCGTKEQRVEATIEEVKKTESDEVFFTRQECSKNDYAFRCEIYDKDGNRYVQKIGGPDKTEYLKTESQQPLVFGKYTIQLPKGWGWQEKIEGVLTGGPGVYCSNPLELAEDFEKSGLEKCNYVVVKDLSENCPECPGIMITNTPDLTMGGGGYITTVDESKSLGNGAFLTEYRVVWEGVWADQNLPIEKSVDENGTPILYYVAGCPRSDLCINFDNTDISPWPYEKVKDFINELVISEK